MYYNPKVYHAASVDTDIASGKRVNYRIPGGKRTGNHPWFLSPYNKQSSLSTDGRAVGEDKYGKAKWLIGVEVIYLTVSNSVITGDVVDITITSGPNAGDSYHRTVGNNPTSEGFAVLTGDAAALGALTNADGSAWSGIGIRGTDYDCTITF